MNDREAKLRRSAAIEWYRRHGKPVTMVIPSYRDAEHVARLVRSIRRTTPRGRARIIVCDDASGPEHAAALERIRGVQVVTGERNEGFAANVNRGIRASDPSHDVVIVNSDTVARRGWLAALQLGSSRESRAGIVGGKLLYPDGRIQFAGTIRNPGAPEWFDHRFRFKPANWGAANVVQPVLAVTGACMYIKRAVIERGRPARRGISDGLRRRRLLPARVAGRLARAALARCRAHPFRVGDAGHRGSRARAGLAARVLGAVERVLRREGACAGPAARCA